MLIILAVKSPIDVVQITQINEVGSYERVYVLDSYGRSFIF
jgi:hypothetical protein